MFINPFPLRPSISMVAIPLQRSFVRLQHQFKRLFFHTKRTKSVTKYWKADTYQNISQNQSFDLNLLPPKRCTGEVIIMVKKVWAGNKSEYNLFFNGDFSFSVHLKQDFLDFSKSPRQALCRDNPAFSIYSMGIREEFKNASMGTYPDRAHTPDKVLNQTQGVILYKTVDLHLPFRSIGINFRYKFGNVDFLKKERPRSKTATSKQEKEMQAKCKRRRQWN